jgi:hypothetical protein
MDETLNEDEVEIVLRQTTLSRDEVVERLKNNGNKYLTVIEEFMGIDKNKNKNKKENAITLNQQIYKEIRTVMDDAAAQFKINNLS